MKELQRQASPNIVIALAGNKSDLADKRLVEYEVLFLNTICHCAYRGLVSEQHLNGQTVSLLVKADQAVCLLDQEGIGSEEVYWIPKVLACVINRSRYLRSSRVTDCGFKYRNATLDLK